MITTTLLLLPLALPSSPLAPATPVQEAVEVTGTWTGHFPSPGTASQQEFTMGLSMGEDGQLSGALMAGASGSALVQATWNAEEEVLLMTITFDRSMTAEVKVLVDGDHFEGKINAAGLTLPISATHISAERGPETLLRADIPRPLPSSIHLHGLKGSRAERIAKLVESQLDEQAIVGLSMACVVEGELSDVRSWGWEDHPAGLEASHETMYRWASVSKLLTAVLSMQLEGAGQLDLDADVSELVPEFPKKRWPVSARSILQHQSGIMHYSHNPKVTNTHYDRAHPFRDRIPSLDKFKEAPLLFEPGEQYSYSTHAYVLLGAVLERAGKAPFRDQIQSRIAAPLNMRTLRPDYQAELIPHRARGYKRLGTTVIRGGDSNVEWKLPGGGFISNVADMARFGLGIIDGSLLAPEEFERFIEPQSTSNSRGTGTGLGIRVQQANGFLFLNHSGSQTKTATYLVACPDMGTVVALMSNSEGTNLAALGNDVINALNQE